MAGCTLDFNHTGQVEKRAWIQLRSTCCLKVILCQTHRRDTCLDRELLVAMVILHILNGSHDTLLHITSIFKQPLHFKAVIERVASKFPSRVCTRVEKSTGVNKRGAERRKR
jgi:hypothetical protein